MPSRLFDSLAEEDLNARLLKFPTFFGETNFEVSNWQVTIKGMYVSFYQNLNISGPETSIQVIWESSDPPFILLLMNWSLQTSNIKSGNNSHKSFELALDVFKCKHETAWQVYPWTMILRWPSRPVFHIVKMISYPLSNFFLQNIIYINLFNWA